MKKTKQVTKTITETVHDLMQCDICKKTTARSNWKERVYDVANVNISYETGNAYPDDYSTTSYEFDVCPDCFKEKIIPFFAQFGATPREVEHG